MAVSGKFYSNFPHLLLEDGLAGSILDATIRLALLANTYTPNQETHKYFDDVDGNEVSGTGYVAGGEALSSMTCTEATKVTSFKAADVSWTGATMANVRYGVVYCDSGDPATSLLIGYIDFDYDRSVTDGEFTVGWTDNVVFTMTVS
jgi:hypothetical protein